MPKLSGDGRGTGDGRSVCKEPETEAETPVQSGSDFINVRVEKLDELQNLTGELIISSVFPGWKPQRECGGRQEPSGWPFLKELEGAGHIDSDGAILQCGAPVRQDCRDICKKEKKEVSFHVQGQNVGGG